MPKDIRRARTAEDDADAIEISPCGREETLRRSRLDDRKRQILGARGSLDVYSERERALARADHCSNWPGPPTAPTNRAGAFVRESRAMLIPLRSRSPRVKTTPTSWSGPSASTAPRTAAPPVIGATAACDRARNIARAIPRSSRNATIPYAKRRKIGLGVSRSVAARMIPTRSASSTPAMRAADSSSHQMRHEPHARLAARRDDTRGLDGDSGSPEPLIEQVGETAHCEQ